MRIKLLVIAGLVAVSTAALADYVDDSIMWSHNRRRAPTAPPERKVPISSST